MTTRLTKGTSWIWPLMGLVVGCAGLDVPQVMTEDIAEKKQQRAEETVRQFERHRDFAEFQAALAYWHRHDLKGCQQGLRQMLDRNPDHRDARLLLVEVYLATDRPGDAFTQVEQALQAYPDDAQVQYTTGLVLDATGQTKGALAYYKRAAELDPESELYAVGYHTALEAAGGTRARSTESTGTVADQPETSSQSAVIVPDPTGQNTEPARLPARRSSTDVAAGLQACHGPEAATEVRILSDTKPARLPDGTDCAGVAARSTADGLAQRGYAALAEGSLEAALVYFREAAARRPQNPQILISAALAALRHNQPDLAVELLSPVENRFSRSAQAHRILGVAYYRLGDYQSSQVALQQALSLDKSSALSYFLMGCTLAKLGQLESAEAHLRQARTKDPRYARRR